MAQVKGSGTALIVVGTNVPFVPERNCTPVGVMPSRRPQDFNGRMELQQSLYLEFGRFVVHRPQFVGRAGHHGKIDIER